MLDETTFRRQSEVLSARLALERGLTFAEQGEAGQGHLWLARGLKIAPSGRVWTERANA